MRLQHVVLVLLAGIGLGLAGIAWAEEAAPPAAEGKGDRPARPFRDKMAKGEGRLEGLRPGGAPIGLMGPLMGGNVPAVREELKRFAEAMKGVREEGKALAQQIRQEVAAAQKEGGEKPPTDDILKKHAQQAEQIATKVADLLVTHHENLVKIYKDRDGDLLKKMGEELLRNMAQRGGPDGPPGQGQGPGQGREKGQWRRGGAGRPGGPPPAGTAPKTAPENF